MSTWTNVKPISVETREFYHRPRDQFRCEKGNLMKCENCGEHWAKHIEQRWCQRASVSEREHT